MSMLADQVDAVIGVDTHHDTHHDTHTASVVTPLGAELAHLQVAADAAGYQALLKFARANTPGPRMVWALEGTRSHGVGLSRALQGCGERVVEVDRPKRPVRKRGKSDPIDAARAARDALTQEQLAQPRADGVREELRVLLVARDHHAGMRTSTVNAFKAFVLTALEPLRAQFRGLSTAAQLNLAVELGGAGCPVVGDVLTNTLAQLDGMVDLLDGHLAANRIQLKALVSAWMPELFAELGSGPSPRRSCWCPGLTPGAAGPPRRSPCSPVPHRCRRPPGGLPATGSTAAGTVSSTGSCTSSRSTGSATTRAAATTPTAAKQLAAPTARPAAA